MSTKVCIRVDRVYGRITYYPANETAVAFTKLTGLTTLRESDLRIIKSLGYAIETVSGSISL